METMNHEYYVSLEVAKLLKEAGFDWECTHYYSVNTLHEPNNGFIHIYKQYEALFYDHNRTKMPVYSAPTLEVAQRWLRKVKNYYVNVDVDCDSVEVFYTARYLFHNGDNYNASYIWEDTGMNNDVKHRRFRRFFDNYEEALEAGIKKALEIINKGE